MQSILYFCHEKVLVIFRFRFYRFLSITLLEMIDLFQVLTYSNCKTQNSEDSNKLKLIDF